VINSAKGNYYQTKSGISDIWSACLPGGPDKEVHIILRIVVGASTDIGVGDGSTGVFVPIAVEVGTSVGISVGLIARVGRGVELAGTFVIVGEDAGIRVGVLVKLIAFVDVGIFDSPEVKLVLVPLTVTSN
jgi:hypothetical protein